MKIVQLVLMFLSMLSIKAFLHSAGLPRFSSMAVKSSRNSILTMPIEALNTITGGPGRSKMVWDQLRTKGLDPLHVDSTLSEKLRTSLSDYLQTRSAIPAQVVSETTSDCGTKKLLVKLADGQQIETVIIPFEGRYSTVCVSTQLGCDRRCTFCATGTMGLLRRLTGTEIVAQVLIAQEIAVRNIMPPITNVVYMGMGDAGGNLQAVKESVECLTDDARMHLSPNKICVSTVGPRPETFMELAKLPATLAWSLHSPVDETRKFLVPSTQHSTVELRQGLIDALLSRENPNKRTIMISFTLIAGINDSIEEADRIIEFLQPVKDVTQKLFVNLIPYNDISATESIPVSKMPEAALSFARPSDEAIDAMRLRIMSGGLFCFVRNTRGEEDQAACGMLATAKVKRTTIPPAVAAL